MLSKQYVRLLHECNSYTSCSCVSSHLGSGDWRFGVRICVSRKQSKQNFQCFTSRKNKTSEHVWTLESVPRFESLLLVLTPQLVMSATASTILSSLLSIFVASGWKSLPVRLRAENALDCCCVSGTSLGIRIACCLTLQLSETRYYNNTAPSLCVCYAWCLFWNQRSLSWSGNWVRSLTSELGDPAATDFSHRRLTKDFCL